MIGPRDLYPDRAHWRPSPVQPDGAKPYLVLPFDQTFRWTSADWRRMMAYLDHAWELRFPGRPMWTTLRIQQSALRQRVLVHA